MDDTKKQENGWYLNRFGEDNKDVLEVNVINNIDSYNKINTSEKLDSSGNRNMLQNHLKDLVHFKSVTNNPMFNLYGTESDIKLEYYDPSGDSWSKRVEPIEMIYNTARLAYKSDEVYVRSIINSDENTPERDMSGALIKNDKYYLRDTSGFDNKNWTTMTNDTYYTDNSYIYNKKRNEMLNNGEVKITSGQTHFPAGQLYGRLTSDRDEDSLLRFEIMSPELEYSYTKRTYESQEIGYKKDSSGNVINQIVTKKIPSVHTHEKKINSKRSFEYYLSELYVSLVSDIKLDTSGTTHVYNVSKDKLTLGYSDDVRKQPIADNTCIINSWNELGDYRFVSLFQEQKNKSKKDLLVHGSLRFRNLYRLNSRLPMMNTSGKVVGLKSINRLNTLESEVVISMWQNVRTVRGVNRKTSKLPSSAPSGGRGDLDDKIFNIGVYQKSQIGFADSEKKNITYTDTNTDVTTTYEELVYKYKNPTIDSSGNYIYKTEDIEQTIVGTLDGNEILSISNSGWQCYAVSIPYTVKRNSETRQIDPEISYNTGVSNTSGTNVQNMVHFDPLINKYEKRRIKYLRNNNCINDIGHIKTDILNNPPASISYPPKPSEKYMGIRINLGSDFDFSSDKMYIIDTFQCPQHTSTYSDDNSIKQMYTEDVDPLKQDILFPDKMIVLPEKMESSRVIGATMAEVQSDIYKETFTVWDQNVKMNPKTRQVVFDASGGY